MKKISRYFGEAMRTFPGLFGASMGVILLMTLMNAVVPWGLRGYLEQVTGKNSYQVIAAGVGLFALFYLLKMFMNIQWYISLDKFGGKYIEFLTLTLEQTMAETSYAEIEKKNGSNIRNVLYGDILNIFSAVSVFLPSILSSMGVILVSLVLALCYEVKITLVICAAMALGVFLAWCSRRVLAKTSGQTNQKMKVYDAWSTQFVDMLPLVQSNPILPYYQKKISGSIQDFISTSIKEDKTTIFWTELVENYHALFSIVLSALLAIPAAGNSVANLVFFTMVANLVMEHTRRMETLFQQIVKRTVSFDRVDELRSLPKCHGDEVASPIERVEFQNVDFTYMAGVSALQGVSCILQKGDCIRLTGCNGGGKSTFIKLLAGLYMPTAGEILINGKPVNVYSRESLNKQILYINQDEKCLNETFQAYLELVTGLPLSEEKYQELLHMVKLPDDERQIAGNGASLSVGQRKKLLLMKLLLRFEQASMIILDEVAVGLDAETTKRAYELLKRMFAGKDKIIIMVEHTLSDELQFHKILDFQNGVMTERERT